jgi:hypothetical protein
LWNGQEYDNILYTTQFALIFATTFDTIKKPLLSLYFLLIICYDFIILMVTLIRQSSMLSHSVDIEEDFKMKVCKNCRKDVDDQATVCPYCRENPDVAKKPPTGDFYNSSAFSNDQSNNYGRRYSDYPATGMCVISFLIPIVGIIYYIVRHNDEPDASGAYLKWAVISIVLTVVAYGILGGCAAAELSYNYR